MASSAGETSNGFWQSLRRPSTALERDRLILLVLLAIVTSAAWALTAYQAATMDMSMGIVARGAAEMNDDMGSIGDMGAMAATGMAGPGAWSWASFAVFVVAWAVMMAAMMFLAAAPMILLFQATAARRRAAGRAFVPTWVFVSGYLLVWTVIGAITWMLIQLISQQVGQLSDVSRETWAPVALGTVLIVAGLYQLTPLKRICLDHCRSPFGFVMQHWCEGYGGALRMGIIHGLYCLGCCWALFAVLVAAGVMSLAWMLLLTLVIFAEKVLPAGPRTAQIIGIGLLLLGVVVASGAGTLPWTA